MMNNRYWISCVIKYVGSFIDNKYLLTAGTRILSMSSIKSNSSSDLEIFKTDDNTNDRTYWPQSQLKQQIEFLQQSEIQQIQIEIWKANIV